MHANNEELGALFVDIDNDDDLDLYLANGAEGASMQDELYVNDGTGQFSKSHLLPEIEMSSKVIAPYDWDGDGDKDLFVGCRNIPGKYPFTGESVFMLNEGADGFRIVYEEFNTDFGMVTDAKWVDLDNDGQKELVLVGEWMHPLLLKVDTELRDITPREWIDMQGWWNCVEIADLDGDGNLDLALGNLGLNNKFHPTKTSPLYLFAADFDSNGSIDIVLGKEWNDQIVPVRGRECSSEQMPFISDKFENYHDFANASLNEILGKQQIESALALSVNTFSSIWVKNKGNMRFETHELPLEAQFSPIYGFVINDFNKDGLMDMVVAGNNSQTEIETTPYDAGLGLYLEGTSAGEFEPISFKESGIFIPGDVRSLLPIHISSDQIQGMIIGKNNSRVNIFMEIE